MTDEMNQADSPYSSEIAHVGARWRELAKRTPDTMHAFGALHRAATKAGALDSKSKELIALAIAVATHCDACIGFHVRDALKAGATAEEIMETLDVCILMGGATAATYATHAMDALDDFAAE